MSKSLFISLGKKNVDVVGYDLVSERKSNVVIQKHIPTMKAKLSTLNTVPCFQYLYDLVVLISSRLYFNSFNASE